MYYKCEPGETIQYDDVTSLYPWVNKYGTFPVGHPVIITENFADITTKPYHGMIKCLIAPPRGLFHPVLPDRVGDKLLFHLCRTCAVDRSKDPCNHSDEERQWWGTWPTCELYKALEMGYVVADIAEVGLLK